MSDIEKQVVSSLANHPELISMVGITQADFSNRRTGEIFKAVKGLIESGKTPEVILLAETMGFSTGENWLPEVFEVFDTPTTPSNYPEYERVLKHSKRHRGLLAAANTFRHEVENFEPQAAHNVVETVRRIDSGEGDLIQSLSDLVEGVVDHADKLAHGEIKPGLQTGITLLDEYLGGLIGGDQIVIAARTSVGKTAMMCNIAQNINAPCLIISGEQGGPQIVQRLLAKIGGVSAIRLRVGKLHTDEWPRLVDAAKALQESPIKIVDKPRPTIEQIEQLARAAKWKYNIEAVFVDYLQLIESSAHTEKRLQVADISKRGKQLARELDIPVVMLAQLNRNADGRRPRISDLKESGSIEEDADAVVLLYPAGEDGCTKPGELTIDLQKHRNGPTGHFNVRWNPEYMRAEDL